MCVCVGHVHVESGAHGGQKRSQMHWARIISNELLNVGAGDRGYCQEKKVLLTTRPSF